MKREPTPRLIRDTNEFFALARQPALRSAKAKFANREPVRQLKLLDGLDSLPGQLDLFAEGQNANR